MSLDFPELVTTFLYVAEAVASASVEDLADAVEIAKEVQREVPHARDSAKFAEPLIIEFLEKALEKRRMME